MLQDIAKFFTNPLIPAVALIGIGLWRKQSTRRWLAVVAVYLYVVTVPISGKIMSRAWSVDDTVASDRTYDAAIILAGLTDPSWYLVTAPHIAPLNDYFRFNDSIDRLLAGIDLISRGRVRYLLIGNWTTEGYQEMEIVSDFVRRQAISPDALIVYGDIHNTLDEAVKGSDYIRKKGFRDVVLVTSEKHMRRARAMFVKQGVEPACLSVSRCTRRVHWKDFVPHVKGLLEMERVTYEIMGYLGYAISGKI